MVVVSLTAVFELLRDVNYTLSHTHTLVCLGGRGPATLSRAWAPTEGGGHRFCVARGPWRGADLF